MKNAPQLPFPHPDNAGRNLQESRPAESFETRAKLWRPKDVPHENLTATASRVALQLIDRATGKAYSADELLPTNAAVNAAIAEDPSATRQVLSALEISGGAPVNQTTATVVISVADRPTAGDTLVLTIAGAPPFSWVFVESFPASGRIVIGATPTATRDNIVAAVAPFVAANGGSSTQLVITSPTSGTAGQFTVSGSSITNGRLVPGGAVTTAVNATPGQLGSMQVDSSNLYVVCAVTSGVPLWKKIALTAL